MFWSIFAGLLSKDVRNRIRILLGNKQTKIHTSHEKTLSQNENRIIKATEKKQIPPLLKLALYKAPKGDAFWFQKRYFFQERSLSYDKVLHGSRSKLSSTAENEGEHFFLSLKT